MAFPLLPSCWRRCIGDIEITVDASGAVQMELEEAFAYGELGMASTCSLFWSRWRACGCGGPLTSFDLN